MLSAPEVLYTQGTSQLFFRSGSERYMSEALQVFHFSFLTDSSCAIPANPFGQCDTSRLDCTRWSPELVQVLENSESNALFPNVDSESGTASSQSCADLLRDRLISGFSTEPSNEGCYTNCTAILSDGCPNSIFLLEDVDSRKIADLSAALPSRCGDFEVACCNRSLPSRCQSKLYTVHYLVLLSEVTDTHVLYRVPAINKRKLAHSFP
jgi:hypothetical protein